MRDHDIDKSLFVDPVTGSELKFDFNVGGREGGPLYDFRFREEPGAVALDFAVLLTSNTAIMADRHRQREGLPELDDLKEIYGYLLDFIEKHERYFHVQELYLRQYGPLSMDRRGGIVGTFNINWDKMDDATVHTLVGALTRLIFLACSRRPDGKKFYSDHLTVDPYDLPGKFVKRVGPSDCFEG